jgi:hypothetical protein
MPERDISGMAVTGVQARLKKLRTRMAVKIPYGPSGSRLTSKEIRMQLQNMDSARKIEMIRGVGPDKWDELMKGLYS